MKRTLFPNNNTGNGLPLGSVTLLSISRFSCGTVTQTRNKPNIRACKRDRRTSKHVRLRFGCEWKRDKGRGGRRCSAAGEWDKRASEGEKTCCRHNDAVTHGGTVETSTPRRHRAIDTHIHTPTADGTQWPLTHGSQPPRAVAHLDDTSKRVGLGQVEHQ